MSKQRRPDRLHARDQTAAPRERKQPREDEKEAPPSLTRELTRVEEANFAFYEAFHKRDITRMSRLWSRSPYARCVHPGWEPVIGWHAIRQSWVDIFRTMKSIEFQLEDVHVEVAERTAWVNLLAHVDLSTEDEEAFATSVVATTIFEKVEDRWVIVLHHSSNYDEDMDDEDLADLEDDEGGMAGNGSPNGAGGGERPN